LHLKDKVKSEKCTIFKHLKTKTEL